MSDRQLKLFLNPPAYPLRTSPLARHSDPVTSKEAALDMRGSVRLGELQGLALRMVRSFPGAMAQELSTYSGQSDPRTLNRRLSELRKAGLVTNRPGTPDEFRRNPESGKRCQRWWSVEGV